MALYAIYWYESRDVDANSWDAQIAQGRYGSASEYIRELIRADEKPKSRPYSWECNPLSPPFR